jgi:hypothetical protein
VVFCGGGGHDWVVLVGSGVIARHAQCLWWSVQQMSHNCGQLLALVDEIALRYSNGRLQLFV